MSSLSQPFINLLINQPSINQSSISHSATRQSAASQDTGRSSLLDMYLKNRETVFLVGLTLLYLLPIWAFKYFPSQDGPAHIYNAFLIHEFINPTNDIFQQYYLLNTNLDPTWFAHLLLVALMYVFDPLISEKVFLTFYVVMFVVSVRYALGAINPNARWLIFLAFPLIYSYILNMGFYANSVSYVMTFFVLGYWLRHSDRWTFNNLVIFGLLAFLLYLFHIVSFAMTMGALGVMILFSIYDDIKNRDDTVRVTDVLKLRILLPLLAILPTLIFAVMFMQSKMTMITFGGNPWLRFKSLLHFDFIASFQLLEVENLSYFYVLLIVVLLVSAVVLKVKKRYIEKNDMLFLAAIACTLVYLVAPDIDLISPNGMKGGGYIERRVMVFPYFLIILWFASQKYSAALRKNIVTFSVLFSVAILATNLYKTAVINEQIEEYLSGSENIEPYTTILPLVMGRPGYAKNKGDLFLTTLRIDPFLHITNHVATQRSLVMMADYEAKMGYFPILYRDELNPYVYIDGNIALAKYENVNFTDYEMRTGGRIDYILVWLGGIDLANESFAQSNYNQLKEKYEKIYTSKNGLQELYRLQ
jgi:hypothetical protein